MLIKCPECEMMLSDKAILCPHCGYPFKPNKISVHKSHKKKRLPNGFGQITEIKGKNLRKPYRAMVTTGTSETGRPICKLLRPSAYFATYNEAYQALIEYNRFGYTPEKDTTFEQLYSEWSERYFVDLNQNSIASHVAAWKYLSPIYVVKVSDMKTKQLRDIVETASKAGKEASSNTKKNIKILLNLLYDYAVENEIVDKNYSRLFNLSKTISKEASATEKEHFSFTDDERRILWQNIKEDYVDMILIQCYTGFRPYELISIKTSDVDLDNWNIIGGMKTAAGTNRIVPIHPAIKELVKARLDGSTTGYLVYDLETGKPLSQKQHRIRFDEAIVKLGLDPKHRPHDCRKDFITMAKKYNVDEYAIKRIVGHAIKDITERVYTDRDIEWLRTEIEKIKVG